MNIRILIGAFCFGMLLSCNEKQASTDQAVLTETVSKTSTQTTSKPEFIPTQDFKTYWYAGEAEITSYRLEQARYGELRDGKAVLVFVTEDFLPNEQVKADDYNEYNTPVLKLNATKNFNTGIYPYSIMQSTFYPVSNHKHALKVSCSVQEWCGHVYSQLNNRTQFEIVSHSYFESEADQKIQLGKAILENELWTQLRIDPSSLPIGDLDIVPSLEFIRLKHVELKAYHAKATLNNGSYAITYPELNRNLTIQFNTEFPYEILGWEETFQSGYGSNAKTLTTKATQLKRIKSAYWSKNSNANSALRDTLLLND